VSRPNAHGLPPHLRKDERGYFLDYYLETDGIKRRKRVRLGQVPFDLVKRVYAKHLEAMIENRFLAKKSTVTFDEAAAEFMVYSRSRKKSFHNDEMVMRNLRAFFQGSPLENLTLNRLERYFEFRRAQRERKGYTLSGATLNREAACLRAIINRAVNNGQIEKNPLRVFKKFKEFPRSRTLIGDEYQRLISHCLPHMKPIIEFAYVTAMRRGEILNLKWKQVDFQNKVILLEASSTKTQEKREIPLDDGLLNLIGQFPKRDENGHVFTYKGRPVKELKTSFKSTCARAGIKDFRFHDLRHCGITNMRKAGVPDNVIMSISGHKTAVMFRRYDAIDRMDRQDAMKRVRRLKTAPDETLAVPDITAEI
jgi:integrase